MAGQKLTDTRVSKAQKKVKTYMLADGGGLCLYVTATGSKLWRWRYRFQGVPKLMALGSYPELSLERVRELHKAMRGLLANGQDPMTVRKQEKDLHTQSTKLTEPTKTVRLDKDDAGKLIIKVIPVVNSFAGVEAKR